MTSFVNQNMNSQVFSPEVPREVPEFSDFSQKEIRTNLQNPDADGFEVPEAFSAFSKRWLRRRRSPRGRRRPTPSAPPNGLLLRQHSNRVKRLLHRVGLQLPRARLHLGRNLHRAKLFNFRYFLYFYAFYVSIFLNTYDLSFLICNSASRFFIFRDFSVLK